MGDDRPSEPDDEFTASRSSVGGSAHEDALAHLTDSALRIKEAIEDRDGAALQAALAPNAKVNINGRFISVEELIKAAQELLGPVEQPTFDILSIEGSEVTNEDALIRYLTELSWIDQKVWEEHSIKGVLALHHTKTKRGWVTDGFSYALRPDVPKATDDVGVGPTPPAAGGTFGGLGGLFGMGKDGGDIWSMWY